MDVVIERRLARRAAKQLGLITRTQLVATGLSRGQIGRMLHAGRLVRVTGDVYLVGGVPDSEVIRLAATCLATGGVASHRSAAHLHGLVDLPPSRSEVTIRPTQNMRQGLLLHRSSDLLSRDIVRMNGIRTTNATRTLIDLGGVVTPSTLENALERALHARLTTFDRLVRRFFEVAKPGRTGVGPLRPLLIDRDPSLAPAESDLETLLFKILRQAGLPPPIRQYQVEVAGHTFYLDAAYPELLIFMEGDGFGVHSGRNPFERDRWRQNLLAIAGWLPLRFTWRRLCRSSDHVVSEVTDAREQRSRPR